MRARFHLTFPNSLSEEPVIYRLGERFGLVTNIRRANLEESTGWAIVEVDGPPSAVEEAVGWLTEQGVMVQRLDPAPGG
ncbi:MAG: NIL domain-containing protein [Actinobacteria bacterium]|nr:NIL domain-containing protein [Actinomycetota bacterium]